MMTVDIVKGMVTSTLTMLLVFLSLYLCTLTINTIRDKNMLTRYIRSAFIDYYWNFQCNS